MPNIKHLAVCPYYQGESNISIKCEDTYRTFVGPEKRTRWTSKYCDEAWEDCKYARELNKAYEKYLEGDLMALKDHEIEAMKSEMRGLSTHLGRANGRIKRQQMRIDSLREENESYKAVNDNLMMHRKQLYKELRETKEKLEQINRTIFMQVLQLQQIYEDRLAYLISEKCGGELRETEVKSWADGKEYAITHEGEAEDITWKVILREDEQDAKLLEIEQE